MNITFDKAIKGHDHEIARANGEVFGFRGLRGGKQIAVQRCAACKRENYAIAVSSGQCCWCGWDANKEFNDAQPK